MSESLKGQVPRPISGHHFSSLLSCPERAWLDLWADLRDRAPDPGYLIALQREGMAHEQEASEFMFSTAVRIPDRAPPDVRAQLTREAMVAGRTAILQGYLTQREAIGIPDVLELVGGDEDSPTGHQYRVGEIKRAATLKTAHVFQLCWYDQLLEPLQGRSPGDAFVILGTGARRHVDLAPTREAYEAARTRLIQLREAGARPGPHLIRDCPSCPWRSVCRPRLLEAEHISLVPGITRERAAALAGLGVRTWRDLARRARAGWQTLGVDPEEGLRYARALAALEAGRPVLRERLRKGALASVRAVALELERKGEAPRPEPVAVHWEDGGELRVLPVARDEEGCPVADLGPLRVDHTLALYGGADYVGFQILTRRSGRARGRYLDVLGLVRDLVHAPLPGYELEAVASFVDGLPHDESMTGRARAAAIRRVLDWLATASEVPA